MSLYSFVASLRNAVPTRSDTVDGSLLVLTLPKPVVIKVLSCFGIDRSANSDQLIHVERQAYFMLTLNPTLE